MARPKKIIKEETVIEETQPIEASEVKAVNEQLLTLIEKYKVQNPVKYELKKDELLKKLNQ